MAAAQSNLSNVVRDSEAEIVKLERRGKACAVVIGIEQWEAMEETRRILSDKEAMDSIRRFKAGKMKFTPFR